MATQHLAKGSIFPPKTSKLRLYSMVFCPFAQRVRLVLSAKDIPHETVNVNLQNKPEWLFELNEEGKVPILDTGSQIITESLVICDYLDEKYPNPPLYPKETVPKQRDKELISSYDRLTSHFKKLAYNPENKTLIENLEGLPPEIGRLENELEKRGNFFGGTQPKMVDYMIWPWAERVKTAAFLYENEKLPFPTSAFPKLHIWYERMKKQKPVRETEISPQIHGELFLLLRRESPVDYDQLYLNSKV